MRAGLVALLTVIALGSLYALLSGAPFLAASLPGGLPVGNAMASVGLCAFGGAAIGLSRADTRLRAISVGSLVMAACWLPFSLLLAGNLELNFSGHRGSAWLALTLVTALAVIGSFLGASLRWLYQSLKR